MNDVLLTRVDEATLPAFAAFLMAQSAPDVRDYLATTDLRALFLDRQGAEAWLQGAPGAPTAAVTLARAPRHDGCIIVSAQILTACGRLAAAEACLDAFLDREDRIAPVARLYRITEQTHQPTPSARLAARGFTRIPGLCEYRRPAGPPRPGEFVLADRAPGAGYRLALFDDPAQPPDPAVADQVAAIHNRMLGRRGSATDWTAEVVLGRLSRPGAGLIIARQGAEIAGHILFQRMEEGILVIETCLTRAHWRSGAVDAMARLLATGVSEPSGLAVIACSDATNAASRAVMKRAGMSLIAEHHQWDMRIEAGEQMPPAPA